MPIIYVQHNCIPDVVKDYIKLHKIIKTYVIGVGTSLNQALVSELPNVEQINGKDKYQRNLAVIDKFKSEMNLNAIYLTSGEGFSAGLSGSALASSDYNPLLLVGNNSLSQKAYLDNNSITNYNITVLGALSDSAIITSLNIDYEAKKVSEMVDIKFEDITKIIFYDGTGRNKPITVEDNAKVKEFMGYLDGCIVKKPKNMALSGGWIHDAVFYAKDKEVMDITFVNPMIINRTNYYDIIEGGLDTTKIDKFLKAIYPDFSTAGYDGSE